MSFSRGGVPAFHPKFPEGSEACVGEQDKEDAIDVADIKYTKEDDLAIDEFHRETLNTAWHSVGFLLFLSMIACYIHFFPFFPAECY